MYMELVTMTENGNALNVNCDTKLSMFVVDVLLIEPE